MSSITEEELHTLQNEFIDLDADGNGVVSIEELRALLMSMRISLRLSESQIKRCLKQIDVNGDGTVDKDEMMDILKKFDTEGVIYKALNARSNIRKDFLRYDTDESGYITKEELVQIIKDRTGIAVPAKHLDLMVKEVDENDDNRINYEEFVKLMNKSSMRKRIY
jgi:calcium-dependent protein kinase